MRSLLSNYFSRLKTIEDSAIDEDEFSDEEDILKFKKVNNDNCAANKNAQANVEDMNKKLEELNMLKFIDDNDSLDSASNLMNEMTGYEENDYDYGCNSNRKSNQCTQTISTSSKQETCCEYLNLSDAVSIQQLVVGQSKSNREVIRTLEKVSENFQEVLQRSNNGNLDGDYQTTTTSLNEIKSWLCLVKKLTLESHDRFKNKMNEKNLLPQIAEGEGDEVSETSISPIEHEKTNTVNSMSRTELEDYNKMLEDRVKLLAERLTQVENMQQLKEKQHSDEIQHYKQACDIIRSDRKRLKSEKVDLLNQTKDLYKTIETKENEIRDFLKHYEAKTKETSLAVKKLIDSKAMIEKEKIELQANVFELMEERNELKLMTESKNATITKLQKQIFELETRSARMSLGREDCGYVSSKSRDTLSSSLIENIKQTDLSNAADLEKLHRQRSRKEERTLKCKSNDFHSIGRQTGSMFDKDNSGNQQKLRVKTRNKSHHQLSNEINKEGSQGSISETVSNYHLDNMYRQLIQEQSDEDFSSSDCITKDKNENSSSALDTALKIDKKIASQMMPYDSQETSCTSSIVSFAHSSSSTVESSGISSSINLPASISISPKSNSSKDSSTSSSTSNSSKPNNEMEAGSTEKLTLSMVSSKASSLSSSPTNSANPSPFTMNQSLTICEDEPESFNKYTDNQMSMSTMNTATGSLSKRSSQIFNSLIKMSSSTTAGVPNSILSSPQLTSIFTTVNTTPSKFTSLSRKNSKELTSILKNSKPRPQSSYSATDPTFFTNSNTNTLTSINKMSDSEMKLNCDNASDWTASMVRVWLTRLGMLPAQIKNAMKHITCGKFLLNMSDSDLEKIFLINNGLHRRKLKLAIEDLKNPEKIKYDKIAEIDNDWLCDVWLKEIGLCQLLDAFKIHLIDGRVLASLVKKDLEKYFGLPKKNVQTSLFLAIDLLRKYEFNLDTMRTARLNVLNDNRPVEVSLWTNENFSEWLKLVNLQAFINNLDESGIHGALAVESIFNVEYLYSSLKVPDETRYFNMKKILEDEIKLLKKTKTTRQDTASKPEPAFLRSFNSFRSDKIMSFRGSLGRALGKKIKRDISSPLVDNDTLKRLEFNHKVVDMRNFSHATSSAV